MVLGSWFLVLGSVLGSVLALASTESYVLRVDEVCSNHYCDLLCGIGF